MRAVAPLLILLSLAASLEQALVQGLFVLRHDYVAAHLCENRDRPDLHCHGKCFLKKRMEETHAHGEAQGKAAPEVLVVFHLLAPALPTLAATPSAPHTYLPEAPGTLLPGILPDVTRPPETTA